MKVPEEDEGVDEETEEEDGAALGGGEPLYPPRAAARMGFSSTPLDKVQRE